MNRPPGRYDDRRTLSPRANAVGAVVLVLALTLATYWAYDRYTSDRVQYTTLSSKVTDTEVVVTFQLRKPEGRKVLCLLNAVDENRVEVGTATHYVAEGVSGTNTFDSHVPTTRRAAAGQVLSCRLDN